MSINLIETVKLNYKDGEIEILAKKAWFNNYFKQFDGDKPGWKNCSNYNLYNSTGRWCQKFEKNVEFVIDRQRAPEPCRKKLNEKRCRHCESDNYMNSIDDDFFRKESLL